MSATTKCPDCQVEPGEHHCVGCDVARCVICGQQQLQCNSWSEHGLTGASTPPMQTWTGLWPGKVECREYGYWARWTVNSGIDPDGPPDTGSFVACEPEHPHATEDLNRLAIEEARGTIVWSRERERYVCPSLSRAEQTVIANMAVRVHFVAHGGAPLFLLGMGDET